MFASCWRLPSFRRTLLDDPVIARRLWAVAARTVDAVAPTGVVKLIEYYRTADEEERLNLYLEHRHLRPGFSAIDEELASG